MKMFTKEWYNLGCRAENPKPVENYINDVCLSIHDSIILSDNIESNKGEQLVLNLNNKNAFCIYNQIIFNNYIVKENCPINNAYCIEKELYHKENRRYELHLLLVKYEKKKEYLNYLTINCKSIEFIGDNFHKIYK